MAINLAILVPITSIDALFACHILWTYVDALSWVNKLQIEIFNHKMNLYLTIYYEISPVHSRVHVPCASLARQPPFPVFIAVRIAAILIFGHCDALAVQR